MRITADTNVLVRAVMADDPAQARLAQTALADAELIAIPSPVMCEFVWVLSRGYGVSDQDIARAIRGFLAAETVETNRPVIEAGLAVLAAGGDFADGVIAFEGANFGASTFVTFDRDAVRRLDALGCDAALLG